MIYVVDTGSLAAWKFFSDPENPAGMLEGVKAWFEQLQTQMGATHVVACIDSEPTRRKAIDPEYKLNRKTTPKPELFVEQLQKLPTLLESLGIPILRFEGEEADDVIASVVDVMSTPETGQIVVVSSDKDLMCLVCDEQVVQYDPRPNKDGINDIYGPKAVEQKLGVPPWRVVDFLSIAGDSADGIKGVVGIGKTYALCAIQQTRSANEIFRKARNGQLEGLSEKTQRKIAEGKDQYEHSKKLVELRKDLPVPTDPEFYRVRRVLGNGRDLPGNGGVSP